MNFEAREDCVIGVLSRKKVYILENKFYQLRDELMKIRISLIDGSANDFDFFRYCEPKQLGKEASKIHRRKIKAKFRKGI